MLPETMAGSREAGSFDGEVKIGFTSLSFAYVSRVTFKRPYQITSEASNSRIFDRLYSHWQIKDMGPDQCEVVYDIQMTFANPIYSSITTTFFDFLANGINQAFEKRCRELEPEKASLQTSPPSHVLPEDSWVWDLKPTTKRLAQSHP